MASTYSTIPELIPKLVDQDRILKIIRSSNRPNDQATDRPIDGRPSA